MQKVYSQVKPLLLNKAKTFSHKTATFLVHCECGCIQFLLFRAAAKYQAKSAGHFV